MLQTQVNYWTLMETSRHNQETERLGFETLAETRRHNEQTERLGFLTLDETKRHNVAGEGVAQGQLALGQQQLSEAQRHNIASEGLTGYSIDVQRISAGAAALGAEAAWENAQTNADKLTWDQNQYWINKSGYSSYDTKVQSGINAQNADSNTLNAQSNATNAETNIYNAKTNRAIGIWNAYNGTVNAIANVGKSVAQSVAGFTPLH